MISRESKLRSSESPGKYSIQSRNRRRRGYSHLMHPRPIQALQQRDELTRGQPHHPSRNDGQRNEPCSRRLVARTRPVPSQNNNLYPVGLLGSKYIDHAAERVRAQRLVNHRREPVHPLAEIDRLHRDQTFTPEEGTIMPLPSARERSSPASRRRRSTERARPSRRRGFPRPLRPAQPSAGASNITGAKPGASDSSRSRGF